MPLSPSTLLCLTASTFITPTVSSSLPANANHIFNAIHSSMRQWGSSLNHNGMSFFLATVPEGTQLYHGDWRSEPIQGPEWLAFEAEHALVFTHPMPHHPPPEEGKPGPQPPPPSLQHEPQDSQQVIGRPDRSQAEDGFLHTFAAAKDLRLLYVDGMSAGKTDNGTMDSQDRILFRDGLGEGEGMRDEQKRAELFCQIVNDRWSGRLDGMLRMEAGFEIILCDFSSLEVLQVARVRPSKQGKPGGDIGMHAGQMWLPAVASRYWKIGGDRVALNYDHFVTAYDGAYELDLFPDTESDGNVTRHPRLEHIPSSELEPLRQDLDALIQTHEASESSTNWQAVADMVVDRYGARLHYLASSQASTLQQLQEEIEDIVTPFIDYDQRNTSLEVERCSRQFVRRSMPVRTVAGDAVLSVSRSVCTTLLQALCHTEYDSIVDQIQGLMEYLDWTTWKDCRGCGDHEICLIPMWPMGTVEDYNHPQCRDISQLDGHGPRYWGGRPPRPKPDPLHSDL
ncbi:uncharacterized protein DSM5745_07444 [Aspergillus mulundensis]|uniref:Uncharacterized protein n=1 Tax=Aspergillus mulundensis TaxID=1810919 RepID=A0A3D8RE19_9EURO|nr:Uncharacterized protein DSM5745_07444 [Aspergillus mulundensis]RDW72272.1 Uncharacterized protein DSM5745_07444 [Aspergillus mulundensis]